MPEGTGLSTAFSFSASRESENDAPSLTNPAHAFASPGDEMDRAQLVALPHRPNSTVRSSLIEGLTRHRGVRLGVSQGESNQQTETGRDRQPVCFPIPHSCAIQDEVRYTTSCKTVWSGLLAGNVGYRADVSGSGLKRHRLDSRRCRLKARSTHISQ